MGGNSSHCELEKNLKISLKTIRELNLETNVIPESKLQTIELHSDNSFTCSLVHAFHVLRQTMKYIETGDFKSLETHFNLLGKVQFEVNDKYTQAILLESKMNPKNLVLSFVPITFVWDQMKVQETKFQKIKLFMTYLTNFVKAESQELNMQKGSRAESKEINIKVHKELYEKVVQKTVKHFSRQFAERENLTILGSSHGASAALLACVAINFTTIEIPITCFVTGAARVMNQEGFNFLESKKVCILHVVNGRFENGIVTIDPVPCLSLNDQFVPPRYNLIVSKTPLENYTWFSNSLPKIDIKKKFKLLHLIKFISKDVKNLHMTTSQKSFWDKIKQDFSCQQ